MVAFGGEVANRFDVVRSTANYRVQHTHHAESRGR